MAFLTGFLPFWTKQEALYFCILSVWYDDANEALALTALTVLRCPRLKTDPESLG